MRRSTCLLDVAPTKFLFHIFDVVGPSNLFFIHSYVATGTFSSTFLRAELLETPSLV